MNYPELSKKVSHKTKNKEGKTRVLIVDKDVLVRLLITKIIRNYSNYSVVGSCFLLESAPDMIFELQPDVILLDVSDLTDNDFKILSKIRKKYPLLPLILLSERNNFGALGVIKGLELGAVDYITKPDRPGILLFAGNHFQKRLIPTIRAAILGKKLSRDFFGLEADPSASEHEANFEKQNEGICEENGQIEAVVIGGCTGAPQALLSLLPKLPPDFPVPIIIALHMPKIYTEVFAEELNSRSHLKVMEGYSGAALKPGEVWLAPGGYHIIIKREVDQLKLFVHRGPRENTCRPSIDVLFRSAVKACGKNVMALVLSGRGKDGVDGSKTINRAGGQVIIQDRKSSKSWELPGIVAKMQVADCVCSLDKMDQELVERVSDRHEDLMLHKQQSSD